MTLHGGNLMGALFNRALILECSDHVPLVLLQFPSNFSYINVEKWVEHNIIVLTFALCYRFLHDALSVSNAMWIYFIKEMEYNTYYKPGQQHVLCSILTNKKGQSIIIKTRYTHCCHVGGIHICFSKYYLKKMTYKIAYR